MNYDGGASMRDSSGRFKKGHHWRPKKPHWDKDWLVHEYTTEGKSSSEIAVSVGVTENAIHYWLAKHDIPRRSVSEARKLKHWGVSGKDNPMFGRTGENNPSYVDGGSPERQRLYVQGEGKKFLKGILKRDDYRCQRCSAPKRGKRSLHVHHIKPWAGNPSLRFDQENVITLCRDCHHWVHSKANIEGEYLDG